jgi:hypothetical protein
MSGVADLQDQVGGALVEGLEVGVRDIRPSARAIAEPLGGDILHRFEVKLLNRQATRTVLEPAPP